MRQKVTVIALQGDYAQVRYHRPTACHGDCDHCGGCSAMAAPEELVVRAENTIGARPGDQVLIEGETGKVAWAIGLVYILPLLLFFVGYALGVKFLRAGTVPGIMGFFLGLGIAVLESYLQKKQEREIHYRIVAFAETV